MEKSLNLDEAAEYLQMSAYSLREKAAAGKIPGSKPGRQWVFRKERLDEYLDDISPWRSTELEKSGTSTSGLGHAAAKNAEFESLLGLPVVKPRRNTTTGSRGSHGTKTS